MKKEGNGIEKNYNKGGGVIPNRKNKNFPDYDSNRKFIFQSNQTNHSNNNCKIKNPCQKVFRRVEIKQDLQNTSY